LLVAAAAVLLGIELAAAVVLVAICLMFQEKVVAVELVPHCHLLPQ
jgi:hypothetical protein